MFLNVRNWNTHLFNIQLSKTNVSDLFYLPTFTDSDFKQQLLSQKVYNTMNFGFVTLNEKIDSKKIILGKFSTDGNWFSQVLIDRPNLNAGIRCYIAFREMEILRRKREGKGCVCEW